MFEKNKSIKQVCVFSFIIGSSFFLNIKLSIFLLFVLLLSYAYKDSDFRKKYKFDNLGKHCYVLGYAWLTFSIIAATLGFLNIGSFPQANLSELITVVLWILYVFFGSGVIFNFTIRSVF